MQTNSHKNAHLAATCIVWLHYAFICKVNIKVGIAVRLILTHHRWRQSVEGNMKIRLRTEKNRSIFYATLCYYICTWKKNVFCLRQIMLLQAKRGIQARSVKDIYERICVRLNYTYDFSGMENGFLKKNVCAHRVCQFMYLNIFFVF